MIVHWEVENGCIGKNCSHEVEIPDEELEGLSKEDRQALIRKYVQDDSNQIVSGVIVWREA